jgi:hypothetical protein
MTKLAAISPAWSIDLTNSRILDAPGNEALKVVFGL